MTKRNQLSPRRQCLKYTFDHGSFRYHGTIGFDPKTATPSEIFLQAGKAGTEIESMGRDAAVLASIALQHGASIPTLQHALTRLENGQPAGPIAALLDRFMKDEGEGVSSKAWC